MLNVGSKGLADDCRVHITDWHGHAYTDTHTVFAEASKDPKGKQSPPHYSVTLSEDQLSPLTTTADRPSVTTHSLESSWEGPVW